MESSDSAAIMAALSALSQDLAAFRTEVRGRFDGVDARLDGIQRGVEFLGEHLLDDPRFSTPDGKEQVEALRDEMRPHPASRVKTPA